MSQFKPGDVVAVRCIVRQEPDGGIWCDAEYRGGPTDFDNDVAPWVSPERIAALEALWAWTEDMLDCADCEDGYCNRHHEEFIEVVRTLAALADPPGSRDREEP